MKDTVIAITQGIINLLALCQEYPPHEFNAPQIKSTTTLMYIIN